MADEGNARPLLMLQGPEQHAKERKRAALSKNKEGQGTEGETASPHRHAGEPRSWAAPKLGLRTELTDVGPAWTQGGEPEPELSQGGCPGCPHLPPQRPGQTVVA